MKITDADKQLIKERVPIVEYLEKRGHSLTPAGAGTFKMLCPVHNERTPSFHVSEEHKNFRCFGCQIGGDIFTLVQELDHLGFVGAVQELAAEAGVTLSETEEDPEATKRLRLKKMLKEVTLWYRQNFIQLPDNHPGKVNFSERNLLDQAMKDETVGWAPSGGLQNLLKQRGYTEQDMLDAGLIKRNENGTHRDAFRSRVTWAVQDAQGSTLGYSARHIMEQDKGPKYLNTGQTVLYNKSRTLLGLSSAKKSILTTQTVYIVEGQTDVMAMNAAGYDNVVASCGTAFGKQHANILMQLSQRGRGSDRFKLIFCFDGDRAGVEAAKKVYSANLDILIHMSIIKFLTPTQQPTDPCDYRRDFGDEQLRKLISGKETSIVEFIIKEELTTWDVKTPEGQAQFLSSALNILKTVTDPVQHNAYVRMVAGWSGVPVEELKNSMRLRAHNAHAADPASAPPHIAAHPTPPQEENFPPHPQNSESFPPAPQPTPADPMELKMLSIVVQYPNEAMLEFSKQGINLSFFPTTPNLTRSIMEAILNESLPQLVNDNPTVASFVYLNHDLGEREALTTNLSINIAKFMRHIHAIKMNELNGEMMDQFIQNSESTEVMEAFMARQKEIGEKYLPKGKTGASTHTNLY